MSNFEQIAPRRSVTSLAGAPSNKGNSLRIFLTSLSVLLASFALANGAGADAATSAVERQLLERVTAGFAAGLLCGLATSDEAMANSLLSGLGQRRFTAQEMSAISNFVVSVHVAQQELYRSAPDAYCEHSRQSRPAALPVHGAPD